MTIPYDILIKDRTCISDIDISEHNKAYDVLLEEQQIPFDIVVTEKSKVIQNILLKDKEVPFTIMVEGIGLKRIFADIYANFKFRHTIKAFVNKLVKRIYNGIKTKSVILNSNVFIYRILRLGYWEFDDLNNQRTLEYFIKENGSNRTLKDILRRKEGGE